MVIFGLVDTTVNGAQKRLEAYWTGLSSSGRSFADVTAQAWIKSCAGVSIAPAPPAAVRNFIRAQAFQGRGGGPIKPQTLKRMLAVISDLHVKVFEVDDPTKHLLVVSELKALYREHGSRAKPIAPLRLKGDVADIMADEPLPGSIIHMLRTLADEKSPWALRTRVILGLGADTGRDRSDYVKLNVGDVIPSADGSGNVLFGAGRAIQEISEAPKFVSPETMGYVREWLEWREKAAPGTTAAEAPMLVRINHNEMPAGRLSVWGYVDVLKNIMRRVGGGAHVSGNSFQAGLKLDLAAIGTTKVGIANALGFREVS